MATAIRRGKWTEDETDALRRLYPEKPAWVVARRLKRTEWSIRKRANRLGLEGRPVGRPRRTRSIARAWTPDEDELLRRSYSLETYREIGAQLGRSDRAVESRARSLGLTAGRADSTGSAANGEADAASARVDRLRAAMPAWLDWPARDDDELARLVASRATPAGVAEALGRPEGAVVCRAHKLGLAWFHGELPPLHVGQVTDSRGVPIESKPRPVTVPGRVAVLCARAILGGSVTDQEELGRMLASRAAAGDVAAGRALVACLADDSTETGGHTSGDRN